VISRELEVKSDSGRPVSEQIASFVRSVFYGRALGAESKLSAIREIAEQIGVWSNTVRQAIPLLIWRDQRLCAWEFYNFS